MEEIDSFQCLADDFFSKWLAVAGYNSITNYIHMLGVGYIRYYLKKWRNLNRFQNQGREAYNAMITAFWHHRTKKGGGKGNINKSKIKPIAQWILRLMLWQTGVAQEYFKGLEADGNTSDSDDESDDD